MNNHFTEEQIDKMKKRGGQFSTEEKRQHEAEWSELIAKVRTELEKGEKIGNDSRSFFRT